MHIPVARDNDRVGYFVIIIFIVFNLCSSNGAWLKIVDECLAVDKHAVYAQSCLKSFVQQYSCSQSTLHIARFRPYGKDQTSKSCM